NGTGSFAIVELSGTGVVVTENTWNFVSVSVNEAGSIYWRVNNSTATDTGTYTSPSTSSALNIVRMFALPSGSVPVNNGFRFSQVWLHDSVALDFSATNALFNATRGRYNV